MRATIFLLLFLPACLSSPSMAAEEAVDSLDRGIRNSDAHAYHLLLRAKESGPEGRELLRRAATYSPDLPAVYFALAESTFSFSGQGILGSVDYLLQGLSAYSRNFWWSFSAAGALFFSLVFSLAAAGLAVVLIRLPRDIPLISHDAVENRAVMILLVVLVALSVVSPLLFVSGMLLVMSLYMKKLDRAVSYLFLGLLLIFPILAGTASMFMKAYSSSQMKAVVEVNESRGNEYAISTLGGEGDFAPLFSYALALKRTGRFEEAIQAYKRLLEMRRDPRVYVNLGNCYVGLYNFVEGQRFNLEEAEKYYLQAINLKPLPSAYYNLSQVSRERFDFNKGNEYFRISLAADRDAVAGYRSISGRSPNRFVVDEVLANDDIWLYALSRKRQASSFGLTPLPPVALSAFSVLLAAVFFFVDRGMKTRAYRCRKCNKILCANCEKRPAWGQMCSQCFASVVKLDRLDVRERVARLLSIYTVQRRRRTMLKVFSFLVPGSAQIYAGRVLSGFLFLWPFMLFVAFPLANVYFVPNSRYVVHIVFRAAALLSAVVLYLIYNLITSRRITRGWL